MDPVTFYSFNRLPVTFELPLKNGSALRLVKFDESMDKGYGYSIRLVTDGKEHEEFSDYYTSFGMAHNPGDVIHAVREYLTLSGLWS